MWLWLALVGLMLTALLFLLEFLGSEQPLSLKEVPVAVRANKTGMQH